MQWRSKAYRAGAIGEKGQALVEFALLLPLLLLLTLGAVDAGRALYALITVNNAAFHSALWATNNMRYGTNGNCGSSTAYCCPTANNTTLNTTNPNTIRDVVIRDFLAGLSYTDTCSSGSLDYTGCNPVVSCTVVNDGQSYATPTCSCSASTCYDSRCYRYAEVTVTYRWKAVGPYDVLLPQIDIPRTVRVRRVP